MVQYGGGRTTFTIPGTATNYAAEKLDITAGAAKSGVQEISILIESLPASAAIELWLCRHGGDPSNASHYALAKSYTAIGLQDVVAVSSWRGAELRGKSGGTGGSAVVSATWA